MREGRLLGAPARVYRVSFTGELTYEINVPACNAQALWEALLANGAQPFGMDALMLMRLEKGFLHLGADTDGTTVPDDVGWGKVAASKKRDYIGKRSLTLPEHRQARPAAARGPDRHGSPGTLELRRRQSPAHESIDRANGRLDHFRWHGRADA